MSGLKQYSNNYKSVMYGNTLNPDSSENIFMPNIFFDINAENIGWSNLIEVIGDLATTSATLFVEDFITKNHMHFSKICVIRNNDNNDNNDNNNNNNNNYNYRKIISRFATINLCNKVYK